ncbi:hypothetical protein ACMGE6_10755 [Macrococcus equi]|uniref:hypothetical protein n=1 Tax=Macrococcus equi TaxID=3395462 RepID=UPI0039BDBDCA
MKYFICPVYGYDKVDSQPYNIYGNPSHNICDCCGFEYGYSEDFEVNHKAIKLPKSSLKWAFKQYLIEWINNDCIVFSEEEFTDEEIENGKLKPHVLNKQLERIGLTLNELNINLN